MASMSWVSKFCRFPLMADHMQLLS